jgi:hypothetical protein
MNTSVLLDRVLELGRDFIYRISGDIGLSVYNFASIVDKEHIDINSSSCRDHDLYFQLINLSKHAYDNNFDLALEHVSNLIKKSNLNLDAISAQDHSQRHIRLLKKDKEKFRLLKKSWQFSSCSFKEMMLSSWNETPSDLCLFERNDNKHLEEIDALKKKENRFKQIGCFNSAESMKRVAQILSLECHHGYKKIPIHWAACIMAKMNGISGSDYKPTLCPYYEYKEIATKEVIEQTGAAENSNIFDHYLIFVPSSLGRSDKEILLDKNIKSIVLGDKDGDCYFICTWQRL